MLAGKAFHYSKGPDANDFDDEDGNGIIDVVGVKFSSLVENEK